MQATRTPFDVIIFGARCAGAPTAMLLARRGVRVLLVDRASFPSDTIGGQVIKPPGVAYLQRWRLLDAVLSSGCPRISRRQVCILGTVIPAPAPDPDALPSIAPRRTVLDSILVEAAAEAGVDVHERTSVSALLREGDDVIGIEGVSRNGRPLRALAPIVIGADGRRSFVAQQVGAAYAQYQSPVSIAYYSYWCGARVESLSLYFAPGRAAGLFPTNDGQVLAFIQCRWAERHAFRADATAHYLAALKAFPAVAEALAGATHAGPLRGTLDLPAYFRQSYGRGWALAGDAAHHKDPLIARGITDAFRDAELLSQAIAAGLGGATDLMAALARCQRSRISSSQRISMLNHRLAELPDDPAEIASRLATLMLAELRADAQLAIADQW